jgi:hypothetical protein
MIKPIISVGVAGVSLAMSVLTWGTPAAVAWIVAFCGWLPHALPDQEVEHGDS